MRNSDEHVFLEDVTWDALSSMFFVVSSNFCATAKCLLDTFVLNVDIWFLKKSELTSGQGLSQRVPYQPASQTQTQFAQTPCRHLSLTRGWHFRLFSWHSDPAQSSPQMHLNRSRVGTKGTQVPPCWQGLPSEHSLNKKSRSVIADSHIGWISALSNNRFDSLQKFLSWKEMLMWVIQPGWQATWQNNFAANTGASGASGASGANLCERLVGFR